MRELRRVDMIVCHHTAGPPTQTVAEIRDFHTRPRSEGGRGWEDIGYHFLIDPEGEVHEGRDLFYQGAHAYDSRRRVGVNGRSVGVAIIGDYSKQLPPFPALEAAARLVVDLRKLYGRKVRIVGHHEALAEVGSVGHTTCPGASDWPRWVRERLPLPGPP